MPLCDFELKSALYSGLYNVGILFTQGTLRPIFESKLKQKRSVRERAMVLRKKVAEAGVNYDELSGIYKAKKEDAKEVCCLSIVYRVHSVFFIRDGL